MPSNRSIASRALLALALMAGFYLLALGISAGLVWVPWAEWHYFHRIHPKLALVCLLGAGTILYSIVPRPDRFEPPGPRLIAARHPRLFAELNRTAQAVDQEMPAEVYLVPDVNAFVTHRGGLMGLGARRVMGLGLPLLQSLRVSELRAVIAHEFGHYHGGDVKLGPWIYKTQSALVRTLGQLSESILSKPFEWYALLFFKISQAVSRHQEYQADALAARVAGAAALAAGLKATHAAAIAFQPYWREEVAPVLDAGYLPPLAGGFARFLAAPQVSARVDEEVAEELRSGESEPFDSHPALRERLAALGSPDLSLATGEEPTALSLLDDVPLLEKQLLAQLADSQKARALKPVAWDDVGAAVLQPRWSAFVGEHVGPLRGLTPAQLASLDWKALGRKLIQVGRHEGVEALALADYAVGAALTVALVRAGFALETPVGAPVRVSREGFTLEPFGLRERCAKEGWESLLVSLRGAGLEDLDLGRL